MTQTPDIERIVRDVLRRLRQSPPSAATGASSDAGGGSRSAAAATGALVLGGRVVSLPQIEGRLQGVRRLQVAPAAVVTPSVRDELRQRGIELIRGEATGSPTGLPWLGWDVAGKAPPPHLPGDCPRLPGGELSAMLPAVVERLAAGATAVLVSCRHHAAAAAANRHLPVRAAAVLTADEVAAAARQLGANLLVVPADATPHVLRSAVDALRTAAAAPAAWSKLERSL